MSSVAPPRMPGPAAPSSFLAPAVLTALCCFPITGVVAVYFASRVGAYWEVGDRKAAANCARKARIWVWLSVLLWVIGTIILIATGRAGRLLESGAF
jgi:hypothetical protein